MLTVCKSGFARSTNACFGNAIRPPGALTMIPEVTACGASVAPKYSQDVSFGVSESTRTSNAPPSFKVPSSVTRFRVTTCHCANAVAANIMKRIAINLIVIASPGSGSTDVSKFLRASVCRLRRCVVWRVLRRVLQRGGPKSRCRSCERRLRKTHAAVASFS